MGFRTGKNFYVSWLERFWYFCVYFWIRILCHIILLTLSLCTLNLAEDPGDNVEEYGCIVLGLVQQFWFFGFYYLFKTNRCALKCAFCSLCNDFWERYATYSHKKS